MKTKKYYFIQYKWRTVGNIYWTEANALIQSSPLAWQLEASKEEGEDYVLCNWIEISEEDYERYESELN